MNRIRGKNILVGITGGIAAYKTAYFVRLLREHQANVRVVMTTAAKNFITPLTFQALTGHEVADDLFSHQATNGMDHINLARWADFIVVAPASAHFIARLVHGFADDLLTTLCLASNAKIAVAPAMNQQMWESLATQENMRKLSQHHIMQWGPASGEQACGENGPGRMIEPEAILQFLTHQLSHVALSNKKIVITAGPTREAIDPVRFLSNYSSGKMGFALAEAAFDAGADVTLIAGPVNLDCHSAIKRINVISAIEMQEHVMQHIGDADIFIATAAVADYRPKDTGTQKIKKTKEVLNLELVRNPDILQEVSQLKFKPICIGFAAETDNVLHHAREKLTNKNLDMIIANQVSGDYLGFNVDENEVTMLTHSKEIKLPFASKKMIAKEIIDNVIKEFKLTLKEHINDDNQQTHPA